MQTIYLNSEDDIVSICDQLAWAQAQRVVFVLPPDDAPMLDGLDLVRLRRYADRLRCEVALVTTDKALRRLAQGAGVPVFATEVAARTNRRGWWRGRRRQMQIGLPATSAPMLAAWRTALDEQRRSLTWHELTWRQWGVRYLVLLAVCLGISLLVVAFLYYVPTATVTLPLEAWPVQATRIVTADPAVDGVLANSGVLPARLITVTQTWQGDLVPTGVVEVPGTSARGRVLFVNETADPVVIPAGTELSTETGVVFQTLETITLAGVLGSTAEVEVTAVSPGPEGNVPADTVTLPPSDLTDKVTVRNLEPMTGGDMIQVSAVSSGDQERLQAQVLQFLQAVAQTEMSTRLTAEEFLAQESLRVMAIDELRFSHAPGEQTERLTLTMTATVRGTAVSTAEAATLVFATLTEQIPPHTRVLPESIQFEPGQVLAVDEQGVVTFELVARGTAVPEIETESILTTISGQEPEVAMAYLFDQLPLSAVPEIRIWPVWFHRVPYTPRRIQVNQVITPSQP